MTFKFLLTSLLPARSTPLDALLLRSDSASGQREGLVPVFARLVPQFGKGGLRGDLSSLASTAMNYGIIDNRESESLF